MVVSAIERFAQVIPLNIQEIFLWYFEQKGVDNPERFLAQGVNGVNNQSPLQLGEGQGEVSAINNQFAPSPLAPLPLGEGNSLNPENQLSNLPPQNNLPLDMNTLTLLLGVLQQVNKEKGDKAKPEDFIKVIEQVFEKEKNYEV